MAFTQIDAATLESFKRTFYDLAEQKMSKLSPYVILETQEGETDWITRMGNAPDSHKKTQRFEDTVWTEVPIDKRFINLDVYTCVIPLDKEDIVRLIADPTAKYAEKCVVSLNLKRDNVIIDAALGNVTTKDNDGNLSVTTPTNTIASTYGGSAVGLSYAKITEVKRIFMANHVEGEQINWVISSDQVKDMFGIAEYKDYDFNSFRPIENGEVVSWMGINWIPCEQLKLNSNSYVSATDITTTFAFSGEAIHMRNSAEYGSGFSSIDTLPQKNHMTQIYSAIQTGAIRLDDDRLLLVITHLRNFNHAL